MHLAVRGGFRLLSELKPTPRVLRETVKRESPLVYFYGSSVRKPVLRELSANTSTAKRTVGMFPDKPRVSRKVAAGCWVLLSLRKYLTLLSNPLPSPSGEDSLGVRRERDSAVSAVPLPELFQLAFGGERTSRLAGQRCFPCPPATAGEPRGACSHKLPEKCEAMIWLQLPEELQRERARSRAPPPFWRP